MELLPSNILTSFEFTKVLSLAAGNCTGELAKKYFDEPDFYHNAKELDIRLTQVEEFKKSLLSTSPLIISEYFDVTGQIESIEVIDFVLTVESLMEINSVIFSSGIIMKYFTDSKVQLYPELGKLASLMFDLEEIEKAISRIIDEHGDIRNTASPRLNTIYKAINSKQLEINRVFSQIAGELKNRALLTDSVETYRNGRRVLSLPVENKRKIRGIIHDESATGKTVYIEPEQIIELNNDLFDLETEYKKEIYLILKKISNDLRPYSSEIVSNMEYITLFDIISAKAKVAIRMKGVKPVLSESPIFNFKNAYHPLLLLKNNASGLATIPFDLKTEAPDRIVVISGPNAGGKSVTLKAIGLIQIMTQSGFLIPADENSVIGIFRKIFADIGDQQSVDDDLSTYSSRLKNMRDFLMNADENTLVLIDEFGTGTDPKIGGAIAEAILNELKNMKVFGVITTHYSNLKLYAFKNKGVINASMHFDRERIKPTYKFDQGKPGSSFAFEMAQNSGLNKKILNYARFKAGKNIKRIEDILVELQDNKAELELKISELREKEKTLDKLVSKNENLFNELEFGRKKLKIERKEMLTSEIGKKTNELNKLISEISRERKLEEAKVLVKKLDEEKKQIITEISETKQQIERSPRNSWKDLKVGDYVRIRDGNIIGQILKIIKNKATVQTEKFNYEVTLNELQKSIKPVEINTYRSINTNINENSRFNSIIDIRGYTKTEAIEALHTFFDSAILANAGILKILHGKGGGTLKNLVKQIAGEFRVIEDIWHPDPEQGGDGITFLRLK